LLRNLLRNQRRWRASSTTATRQPRQQTVTLRRTSTPQKWVPAAWTQKHYAGL